MGMLLRWKVSHVQKLVEKFKLQLTMFSNTNLIFIFWTTISNSQQALTHISGSSLFSVLGVILLLHVLFLLVNYSITKYILQLSTEEVAAITILASQKSAAVSLPIIAGMASDQNNLGLFAIPCILGQTVQLLTGTMIANRFSSLRANQVHELTSFPSLEIHCTSLN